MVSSKQKHDLKFEQNPSLLNGHKKFILYSCRVSQSEEGKEKKDTNLLRVRETDVKY